MIRSIYYILLLCILSFPFGIQAQVPPGMEGFIQQQKDKQEPKEYKVLPAPSVIGAGVKGIPASTPAPFRVAFETGEACILVLREEFYDYCPDDDDGAPEVTAWIMRFDQNNSFNSFSVHPANKKANLRLQGPMDKYVPGPNYCENGEMKKAETGLGTFVGDFTTYLQTSPRTFQVIEQGPPDSQTMKDLKELRDFYQKNMMAYLKHLKDYQYKPHVRIGGNGRKPPPPDKRPPIKHGTQDGGDGDSDGWSASRDGMGYAKTALDAFSAASSYVDVAGKAAKLYGAVKHFKKGVAKAALDVVASAASAAGYDASGMAEAQMMGSMDMMVAAMAEVNKKYADNGNKAAIDAWNRSQMPVKDDRFHQPAVDAGFLLHQLNELFDQIEDVEAELENLDFPKSAVRGSISGPGLYQNLASLKQEGAPITMIATSTAVQEGMDAASPENLQNLQDMGFDIPEEVMNMDIEAMMNEAQGKIDGKVDMDIRAPLFNGTLSTTNTVTLANGYSKVQNYQIFFAISSPNEAKEESWLYAESIFDDPINNNEDPNQPKEKVLYVATNGNDQGLGTNDSPFATLQKALEEALDYQQDEMAVKIMVKDGTYRQKAEMDWTNSPSLGKLTITSENRHGAVFIGSEPVSENIEWERNLNKEEGGWIANPPLHPEQWFYSQSSNPNPMENPAPVLVVDGKTLFHLPMIPAQANGMYSFSGSNVKVAPQEEVSDLNEATVEVSTRKFALQLQGGGSVEVSGIRFLHYPYPSPNNSPGVLHDGNVLVTGCKFN